MNQTNTIQELSATFRIACRRCRRRYTPLDLVGRDAVKNWRDVFEVPPMPDRWHTRIGLCPKCQRNLEEWNT